MCGFAGIVTWDNRHRVHRDVLERMSARIAHRGPDDQGLWINHEEEATPGRPQVGLAFRRLSIIDLDPRANQPFTDGCGRWLVFNGEIYNYRELRKELQGLLPDYAWRTQGDAEVLLASYAAWGEKCVERLNGMFAFAVWDEPKRELFTAVDRMGQKPLYWAALSTNGDVWPGLPNGKVTPDERGRWSLDGAVDLAVLAFASELTALLPLSWLDTKLSDAGLSEYLRWGFIPSTKTIYHGVRKFEFATCGVLTRTSVVSRHYFDANTLYNEYVGMSPLRTTRERIERAVQRQLVADVPIGCFLSGGIDSSIIAATMTRLASDGQEVLTFSIGFDDPRYDETGYAAAVARMLGTRHEHFTVHPDAAADLPTLAAVWGEPFGDSSSLPTHYLARETRQRVKVALSGDGGDELFGGYDRYRAMRMTAVLDRLPSPVRRLAGSRIMQTIPGTHPKSTGARLKRFLLSAGEHDAARRYVNMIRLFDERLLLALVPEWDARGAFDSHVVSYFKLLELQRDPVEAALASDRTRYLPGDLLTKVDRCSMLHSLEVRSPFMDHELVEFAANLTTPELLKGGPKRMLREAFAADLPAWVFKRKKMGFAVPIGEWFRSSLRPMLHDHLFATDSFAAAHFNTAVVRRLVDEHESQRTDHSQRLYALLMLELWWRTQQQQQQRTQRVP